MNKHGMRQWIKSLSAIRDPKSPFWRRSLRTKIIAWSFVPTAIILLAVALVTFFAFQSVTEQLVLQRDREVTFVLAGQLAAKLGEYEDLLSSAARTSDIAQGDPTTQRDALKRAGNRLAVYDGGVLLLDVFGTVVAAEPERRNVPGQDWSDRAYYQQVVRAQITDPAPELILSDIVADGPDGADVIAMALPVVGEQDRFRGVLGGMFRTETSAASAFYGDILKLRIGESGSTYLVDEAGRVIYHSDAGRIGEDFGTQAVVRQVLSGQTDAIRTRDFAGNDIVAGFAPVPGTPWGLVTEETWSTLTGGFRGYRNFLVGLLVLGVVVPAIVVNFGVRRITKPITDLIDTAQEVARGNFGRKISAQTGDELEELAEQFNLMSDQLQESYTNLEQRVADRTRELATLNTIAGVVSRSLDLDEILHDALVETLSMLDVDSGVIYLTEPGGEVLTLRVHHGLTEEFVKAVQHVRLGEGITGQAVAESKPIVLNVPDYARAESSQRLAPSVLKEGLQTMASTPLIHTGQALGALTVGTRRPRAFPPQELELLTAIGQQIGVAVENAGLFAERERRVDEMAVLNQVSRAISSILRLDELLDLIYHQVGRVMDSTNLYIALYDKEEDWVSFPLYFEEDRVRKDVSGRKASRGLTEYIIRSRHPLLLPNTVESRLQELGIESIGTSAKSCLGVPMIASDEVLGVITVQSYTTEDVYDEGHLDLLSSIAAQAAISIQNARLYERAQQELAERERAEEELRKVNTERALRNRELTLLNRVIAATTSRLEIPAVLEVVCRELALAFGLPEVGAALLDKGGATLTVVAEYMNSASLRREPSVERAGRLRRVDPSEERPSALGEVIPVEGNPATHYVLQHNAPLAVVGAQHDPRMAPVHDLMRQRNTASILILPLTVRGEVVGTIGLVAVERREFTNEEIDLAANAAAAAAQALENAWAEESLREAKTAAEEAMAAAEAANRAKSIFLANMSHELRTPLNAILGFAQLMMRESLTGDPGLTAEQQENLETIGRSGEHLLGLINDVLDLSKIEAGRVALQEESFDLHRLSDGLEEMFHLRATDKGLMLIFDRAPDVPQYVRTDEGKLRQVLMNLLGNAVKFTQEGGVTLRVGCANLPGSFTQESFREGSPRLLFEVEDTGPGIAPGELDAVFDPFKQTASGQQSQEGTGLGMPISRQFVRLMGGDLTFSSELGVGSLFRFDVPIELVDAGDVPTLQPARRVIGLEPGQRAADGDPYRLLVVEDREASRRLLVKLLAPLGFELQEAINGQEALAIWERWKPHLIWMDMRMPVMDGHEATQRIKATTQGQATVVVALTASAFEEDRAMILSGSCDDFVRKPFREEEIFDTLTKHLGVRFVYDKEGTPPTAVQTEPSETALTTEALATLPPEWMAKLHQAATQLDADVILDMLDQVREQNPSLADALARLVHDYRFDIILTLTAPTEDDNE